MILKSADHHLHIVSYFPMKTEIVISFNTLQVLYNTVLYNRVLDITRFKDGSQKCIDYIEK